MTILVYTALQNAVIDSLVDAVDGGSGPGLLEFWTTGFGTLLATLTFSDPAYDPAAGNIAIVNSISPDTSAAATGAAAVFRVTTSTPTTVFEGNVGTFGSDINFNTTSFVTGDKISVSALGISIN